jgi:lipopolysaccharide transport system ATP-binding protein
MENKNAIRIRNIGKKYFLGEQNDIFTATEYLSNQFKKLLGKSVIEKEDQSFWALRNIDYTLEKGKVLGVIGKNGSGKSTLLKILSRITTPTEGEFGFNGTIASLLEVGTGFKPELTGYDNIFLSGTTLGMKHAQIAACIDDIIKFAELEKFINTPVKRYSSGMYVRLAFAVAAHLDPDILLIDEVLAVGDMKFQRKCLERMGTIAKEGRTVVFVSHNMQAVSQLCDEGILLNNGKMITSGKIDHVVEKYQDLNLSEIDNNGIFDYEKDIESKASITKITVGSKEDPRLNFDILEEIPIIVEFEVEDDVDNLVAELSVHTLDGMCIMFSRELDWHNHHNDETLRAIETKKSIYSCQTAIPSPLLNSGFYELKININSPLQIEYSSKRGIQIHITDYKGSFSSTVVKATSHGVVCLPLKWTRETT